MVFEHRGVLLPLFSFARRSPTSGKHTPSVTVDALAFLLLPARSPGTPCSSRSRQYQKAAIARHRPQRSTEPARTPLPTRPRDGASSFLQYGWSGGTPPLADILA